MKNILLFTSFLIRVLLLTVSASSALATSSIDCFLEREFKRTTATECFVQDGVCIPADHVKELLASEQLAESLQAARPQFLVVNALSLRDRELAFAYLYQHGATLTEKDFEKAAVYYRQDTGDDEQFGDYFSTTASLRLYDAVKTRNYGVALKVVEPDYGYTIKTFVPQ